MAEPRSSTSGAAAAGSTRATRSRASGRMGRSIRGLLRVPGTPPHRYESPFMVPLRGPRVRCDGRSPQQGWKNLFCQLLLSMGQRNKNRRPSQVDLRTAQAFAPAGRLAPRIPMSQIDFTNGKDPAGWPKGSGLGLFQEELPEGLAGRRAGAPPGGDHVEGAGPLQSLDGHGGERSLLQLPLDGPTGDEGAPRPAPDGLPDRLIAPQLGDHGSLGRLDARPGEGLLHRLAGARAGLPEA